MINTINNEILNGTMNLSLITIEDKNEDLIVYEDNIVFALTTSENQKNKEYKNISKIKLGECENILRNHYNLSDNDSLIIFKIDIYEEKFQIPILLYQIYSPKIKTNLDLNLCKDTKINIIIPVSIDENCLFKYNPSSDYYNDICYTYTTEMGTDITLKDRRDEFINNNLSLCEENWEFERYNFDEKTVLCKCLVKIKLPFISEIEFDKNKLKEYFNNVNTIMNINIMKCYYLLLNDGLFLI